MIKKFNQYIKESNGSEIEIIRSANGILKRYKDSPMWNQVILALNEGDIDYYNWSDLDMLDYYLSVQEADIENMSENAGDKITEIIASNMSNYLGMIIDTTDDEDVKKHGSMLGRQLNTAGGKHMMKDEVVSFVYKHRDLIPDLIGKLRNVKIDDITE